jgi:hypothetical protein
MSMFSFSHISSYFPIGVSCLNVGLYGLRFFLVHWGCVSFPGNADRLVGLSGTEKGGKRVPPLL